MPRTRRSGVIPLTDRAARIPTTATRTRATAGNGAPCNHIHWYHGPCTEAFTTWTLLGGRCDHHPVQPHEMPVIREQDRQPWVRSKPDARFDTTHPADAHPFIADPHATGHARVCLACGRGPRTQAHQQAHEEAR